MIPRAMHSWIFRNRERLALVYGSMEPPPAEAPAPAGESLEDVPAATPADDQPAAGTCTRTSGEVLLMPMRRP